MALTLKNITDSANAYTDEQFTETKVRLFVNEAISQLNTEVRASLPLLGTTSMSYDALSDSWINTLIIPYVCYSIKTNDGSLNEADRFYQKFNIALQKFIIDRDNAVPDAYKEEEFDGVYRYDGTIAVNLGYFSKVTDDEGF